MTKFCVKKPFFIVVAVIIILTLGGVSLTKMQTDLMPDMEIPYMVVVTTEPGASPEKVETDVTKAVESTLGTISGVENINSTSAENYSMVMLEFTDDTDMNSALVRVSKAVDSLELPEGCGTPNIMEVSMDMMATMYASVEYKGKDIKDISQFTEKVLKPYIERQDGVASVSDSGNVEDSVEIRLNEKKIDKINDKILYNTNEKLKDAQDEIDKASSKLKDAKSKLSTQEDELQDKQKDTNKQLADASVQLDKAQATKAAYESSLNSLKASKAALEAEKKAYEDAKVEESYKTLNKTLADAKTNMAVVSKQYGVTIPGSVKEAIDHPKDLEAFAKMMSQTGHEKEAENLTVDALKKIYNIVEVRIPQINTELANLDVEILAAQKVVDSVNKSMKGMDEKQSDLVSGGYEAAAGFGSAQAQMAAGEQQIETAEKDLEEGQKKLDDSKKAAIENSNIDALLSLDTLSSLITAQNFSMPAGYVEDKDSHQWLVKVGDTYSDEKELSKMVLTKIKGVGTIKLSDVADITIVDNAGESYAKINGKDAVLLSIYKSSTSNTSKVSEGLEDAFGELEDKYDGLEITPMINQADYITMMVESILSSILLGALLAIVILALFLKDVKPTLIVAFSIPFSVLFAIIIMYFTGMTLNVMSLAGLCLGIGMLVDNSIVVIENIYRLRNRGMSAARAAVQGAKQVAAPIIASTITTICVFFPMVYVSGIVSQLLIPFAFTISYALVASLLVALTVVPTIGSMVLKNTKMGKHKWFDAVKERYGKLLAFCLRYKAIPLGVAVLLFAICVWQTSRMGLIMMNNTESDQIIVNMTLDKDTEQEEAYKRADETIEAISKIEGVAKVAAMDGNTGAAAGALGSSTDNYTQFMFFVVPEEDITTTKEFREIRKAIEKNTSKIECEDLTVSSSAMGGSSSLMSQGLQVNIYGEDQNKLIDISNDIMKMMENIEGCENITNGLDENDKQIHLEINKDKAAKYGLTVAQIYQQIAGRLTTEKTAVTLSINDTDVDVNIVDETDNLTYENILKAEISATTRNDEGEEVNKTYKLSKFASITEEDSAKTLTRQNQTEYMSVTAETKENYNTTLLSRKLQKSIDSYEAPDGYVIEIEGETEQVREMIIQLCQAIALGFLLIYLVMVAQFQSMLSPFIILFTIPLAFTGGLIGLLLFGEQISAMAMMGFMILMGTVVNNGIVFVDYVNQLRLQGVDKRTALVATGKVRMRPILMTALTTICSMSVMVFSQDAGNAMQKPMAIVVCFGLIYATVMTLFIVPVMYDIFYRRKPTVVDVGDDNLDEIPNEAEEFLQQMEERQTKDK
ncbi:MAG: efflux RND transporter permease subunit [Eubacterium sp.]